MWLGILQRGGGHNETSATIGTRINSGTPPIQTTELWSPSIMDTCHWNQTIHYNKHWSIFNPWNKDTSIIRTVLSGPKVSGLQTGSTAFCDGLARLADYSDWYGIVLVNVFHQTFDGLSATLYVHTYVSRLWGLSGADYSKVLMHHCTLLTFSMPVVWILPASFWARGGACRQRFPWRVWAPLPLATVQQKHRKQ